MDGHTKYGDGDQQGESAEDDDPPHEEADWEKGVAGEKDVSIK